MRKQQNIQRATIYTKSTASAYMAQDPARILEAEHRLETPAMSKDVILANYRRDGYEDVRFNWQRHMTAPSTLNTRDSLRSCLERDPKECPVSAYAEEAYNAYLEGYLAGCERFFPRTRPNPYKWDEVAKFSFA